MTRTWGGAAVILAGAGLILARAACSGGGEPPAALASLPATFAGDLPCADCEGVHHHLDLFPDGTFALRLEYRGMPGDPVDAVGRWATSDDGKGLVLTGSRDTYVRYAVAGPSALRLLGRDGSPIVSELNYTLTRSPHFDPIEPRLELRGLYCYLADAGVFTECETGWRLPVAAEGDNRALEAAYLAARNEPGDEALVTLRGRIVRRMPAEGPGPVRILVPEAFLDLVPDGTCN